MSYTDLGKWRDDALLLLTSAIDNQDADALGKAWNMVNEVNWMNFIEDCVVERPFMAMRIAKKCEEDPSQIPVLIDILSKCGARMPNVDEALELLEGQQGEAIEAARLALQEGTPVVAVPHMSFNYLQELAQRGLDKVDEKWIETIIDVILKSKPKDEVHVKDDQAKLQEMLNSRKNRPNVCFVPELEECREAREIHIHIH